MPDLRKIFMVLAAALAMAFLVTIFFVYNFGPSGKYPLNTVLLEPNILAKLNYNDWNTKINGNDRFIFEKIVYESNGKTTNIDLKTYEKIYQLLQKDISTIESGEFSRNASHLTIYVRTESPAIWQYVSKVFQQAQFATDSYRVQLHEDKQGIHFVEFQHPQIKEQVEALING